MHKATCSTVVGRRPCGIGARARPQRCPIVRAAAPPGASDLAAAARVAAATALYAKAWSEPGGDALLADLVSDSHAQCDEVWQADRPPRVGRASLAKGMRHMRRIYPDLTFTVAQAVASPSSADVFVEWELTGTWEGKGERAFGVSVLAFDAEGKVSRTRVFRQALAAEVEMARRGVGGAAPVEQGALLERKE